MPARFAFVVDGEVVGSLLVPDTAPHYEARVAGLSSDPKVIPAPVDLEIRGGWTYDGSEFHPPTEG